MDVTMYITIGVIGVPPKTTINYMIRYYCMTFINLAGLLSSCYLSFMLRNMTILRHSCRSGRFHKGYPQLYNKILWCGI